MKNETLYPENRFTWFCTQSATVVLGVIFSLFAFAAFLQTETFNTQNAGTEALTSQNDNLFINTALLMIFLIAGLFCARKHIRLYRIDPLYVILIMIILTTTLSGLWNIFTQLPPISDSSILAYSAADFANGDYSTLRSGENPYAWDPNYYRGYSYFAIYPFQLGYVFISEMLIRIFGTGDAFFTLKMANIIALDFAYLGLILIIEKLIKNRTVIILSAIGLTLCLQSVFYTVFTYGTLIGLAFAVWAIYFTIKYMREHKLYQMAAAAVLITLSVLSKYNNMIIAIAISIALILHVIDKKRFIALILAVCVIALPFISQKLVIKSYESRAGVKITTESKQIQYLALGLSEGENPGWYNPAGLDAMLDSEMDQKAADENAKTVIDQRMQAFSNDPAYAVSFFLRKLLTQFNEPSFASLWLCQSRDIIKYEHPVIEQSFYTGGMNQILMFYFNFYGMIIYLGFALYLLRAFLRNETSPDNVIIPITLIGAIIYHLLFEAKSLYIYPYFVMIIPFAMAGLYFALKAAAKRSGFILDMGRKS